MGTRKAALPTTECTYPDVKKGRPGTKALTNPTICSIPSNAGEGALVGPGSWQEAGEMPGHRAGADTGLSRQCTCLLLASELIGALQGQLLLCFGRHAAAAPAASCLRCRQGRLLWFAATAAALRVLKASPAPAAAWLNCAVRLLPSCCTLQPVAPTGHSSDPLLLRATAAGGAQGGSPQAGLGRGCEWTWAGASYPRRWCRRWRRRPRGQQLGQSPTPGACHRVFRQRRGPGEAAQTCYVCGRNL